MCERAQARMEALLPAEIRQSLMAILPEVARLTVPDFYVHIDVTTCFCCGRVSRLSATEVRDADSATSPTWTLPRPGRLLPGTFGSAGGGAYGDG